MGQFDGNIPSTGANFRELLDGFSFIPGASGSPWSGSRRFLWEASGGDSLPERDTRFPDVPPFVIPDALTVRDYRVYKKSGVYHYDVKYSTSAERIEPTDAPQTLQVNMSSVVLENIGTRTSGVVTEPPFGGPRVVDFPLPFYIWGATYTIATGVPKADRDTVLSNFTEYLGKLELGAYFASGSNDGNWLSAGLTMDEYLGPSGDPMLRFTYNYSYKRINVGVGSGTDGLLGTPSDWCGWNSFWDPKVSLWVRIDPPIFQMTASGGFPAEHLIPFLDEPAS